MTTLYFVRHAEPNYENHDDRSRELSEKGLSDRRLVTEYLSDKGVDAVLSSPFRRAVDTVADFARVYGHRVETVDGFRERRVDSAWIEDFDAFARRQWEDFDYKLSDGETLREVQRRNIRALDQVLARFPGKTVVVGSHGTALCTVIQYFRKEFGFADFERVRGLMPWVVRFAFDGGECREIQAYDVFTGQISSL